MGLNAPHSETEASPPPFDFNACFTGIVTGLLARLNSESHRSMIDASRAYCVYIDGAELRISLPRNTRLSGAHTLVFYFRNAEGGPVVNNVRATYATDQPYSWTPASGFSRLGDHEADVQGFQVALIAVLQQIKAAFCV